MVNELKKAEKLLSAGDYTCVLCCGDSIYTDTRRGVRPLLDFLENGTNLQGYTAADKVVGKGAAFLYVLMGVRAVYAQVISAPAIDILTRHGIEVSYSIQVSAIENRTKTGLCPIESSVWDIDNPQTALETIRHTLTTL